MIQLQRDLVGIKPIRDPDKSQGTPDYTAEEIKLMKELGTYEAAINKKGSLHIPDDAIERTDQGIVAYVGPKVRDIRKGDYVLFSGYSGTTVQFEKDADGTLIIMREKFVTCILEAPNTDVKGLYFRASPGEAVIRHKVMSILRELNQNISGITTEDACNRILRAMWENENESYFPATYEMAMNLIAMSFEGTDFAKGTGFVDPISARPSKEEYDDDDTEFKEEIQK